jgi:L-alanine-DL-glutamate epimerase-like enolase superfamily enzyme
MRDLVRQLTSLWTSIGRIVHPLISGYDVQTQGLHPLYQQMKGGWGDFPFLAVQVLNSAFDIALYDGFAKHASLPVYDLFHQSLIPVALDSFFISNKTVGSLMKDQDLDRMIRKNPSPHLGVWHMVGILDPLDSDGENSSLADWIIQGGVTRLKIKLSSQLAEDLDRVKRIYKISHPLGVEKYSFDYNGSQEDLKWIQPFLSDLKNSLPGLYERLCYIEQPICAGLTGNKEDVSRITEMKDLLVDEGAGNWEELYEYYQSGWSGVALKICKSQTSSLLMFALSRVLEKRVTVMDLTNPSLAHIAHAQLAAHMSDDSEIESNAIQYCPTASVAEAQVHPGLFSRSQGGIDISSLSGFGYGYRMDEIQYS